MINPNQVQIQREYRARTTAKKKQAEELIESATSALHSFMREHANRTGKLTCECGHCNQARRWLEKAHERYK